MCHCAILAFLPNSCLNLNNSGASDDSVVSGSGVARGKDNVALARDTFGDNNGVAAVNGGGVSEDRSGHGDESGVNLSTLNLVALGGKGDSGSSLDGRVGARCGQDGESLNGQRRVGGGALSDELSSEGVDLVIAQWVVEGRWEWRLANGVTDVGGVTGLNGQDGTGSGQVSFHN